ncbi:unnamed protein product [Amoebophrya sp. A120]|nr:unnamed protein product [Amoebophrya sp. A120]|eukprot:GSA120T00021958001.1
MLAGEDWWLISWRPGKYIMDLDYRASENFIDVADRAFRELRPDVTLRPNYFRNI